MIRHALRNLARYRGFTAVAVLTLALGIGANTAIFSAFYRILYAPLPYAELDRLVYLFVADPQHGMSMPPALGVSDELNRGRDVFTGVGVTSSTELTLTGNGDPVVLPGGRISAALPEVLGARPLRGRVFTEEEQRENAAVVLLSEGTWRRRFGGEDIIGRTVQLGGVGRTVIGIMPDVFRHHALLEPVAEFWIPFQAERNRESPVALARLAPGVTVAEAEAALGRAVEGQPAQRGQDGWVSRVTPLLEMGDRQTKRALPVLLGAVALVLLIACANVAGLLMVRLHGRAREISIRTALGASRRRIIAELFAEQALLALAAGGVGLLLAAWLMTLMRRFRPAHLDVLDTIALQPQVLLFACALVGLTTLLFGVLPACAVLRRDPVAGMRGGGRATVATRSRSVLVGVQIGMAVTLVTGAVLLIRSFHHLRGTEIGFDPANRLVVEFLMPRERYSDTTAVRTFYEPLLEGVAALPTVRNAGLGSGAPPRLGLIFAELTVPDRPDFSFDQPFVEGTLMLPGYLAAIGARMIAGRDLSGEPDEVVINRAMAERIWPGESAIGRRLQVAPPADDGLDNSSVVVGVIENVRAGGPLASADVQMFVPLNWGWPAVTLVLETDGNTAATVAGLRQVVRRIDADVPVRTAESMERRIAATISRERFLAGLLTSFAATALLLTAVGLYALIAWSVQLRAREIGIRMTLGAGPASIRRLFMTRGAALTAAGTAAGLVAAWLGARVLESMLHGVTPADAAAWLTATAVITATTMAASWLPARRAARMEPLATLRAE